MYIETDVRHMIQQSEREVTFFYDQSS
jgi:hypothetical protein